MNEPDVVNVGGLRKAYGSRVVVDRLHLDVHVGEIVGLVGSNGAAKTTTVECIQGFRRPDGGTLSVLGFDPITQAAQLRPPAMAANCSGSSGWPDGGARRSPR